MSPLPPGTILQYMYLKQRLAKITPGRFIEVGTGQGYLSNLLLSLAWQGIGYELNPASVAATQQRNNAWIERGQYTVKNTDWLKEPTQENAADLIISCMVLEHLPVEAENKYVEKSKGTLSDNGVAMVLVPASNKHWGIEDDIAGHLRRYSKQSLTDLFEQHDFIPRDVTGLTYPISNLLLPISNFLVQRKEKSKMSLSEQQRTEASGNRNVAMKTSFPLVFNLLLNELTMAPFHGIQQICRNHPDSLVLYGEFLMNTHSSILQ